MFHVSGPELPRLLQQGKPSIRQNSPGLGPLIDRKGNVYCLLKGLYKYLIQRIRNAISLSLLPLLLRSLLKLLVDRPEKAIAPIP